MLLNLPIILPEILFNSPIIPEIILKEIALFTMIQQTITLSKYKKLSETKDFLRRCHRYVKYLIVGSSFYKCECIMAWETKQQL